MACKRKTLTEDLFSLSMGTDRKLWVGGWRYKKFHKRALDHFYCPEKSQRDHSMGLCNAPFLDLPSAPPSANEASGGARGVSQPRRERRAAGVCVCQQGLGEEAKPSESEVTSGLLGNCISCQHCRHGHHSSGQARATPSDGLAL